MKRLNISLICVLMLSLQMFAAQQSVGLVLSGGGAKGIAHIGFIQALEENDIPIDYITGTSMGAIVGGLYACGYTPAEMMELIGSRGFAHWSTGRIDPELTYYFNKPRVSPTMFSTTIGKGMNKTDAVAASIIPAMPMSYAFMELFSSYTATCNNDFSKLFVPFRCVASDVNARKKVVMRKGNLGDAIRTSMTFPIVFQPISINGKRLYDGGIYDNFPVDVMRDDFNPSIMIGVNVSSSEDNDNSLMAQIDKLVIQESDYTLPAEDGIKVNIDLKQFSLLDFERAHEIYEIGYSYAMENMDSIKSRISRRTSIEERAQKRAEFKSRVPELRFEKVNVTGGESYQNEYIEYLFHPRKGEDTIGAYRARDAYYKAITSDKLHDLFPRAEYNKTSGLFTLNLKASIKSGLKGSIGGYVSSSPSSFLYGSLGYSTLGHTSLNTNLEGWVGQSALAVALNGRFYLHTQIPSALTVIGVASRERFYDNDYVFFEDKVSTSIANYEYFGKVVWSFAASRHGALDIGVGGGRIRHTYDFIETDGHNRLRSTDDLAQAFTSYTFTTLDNQNFPLTGHHIQATAAGLIGRNITGVPMANTYYTMESRPKWLQLHINARNYPALNNFITLGVEADVLLSTRKLLPTYSAAIAAAEQFCPTPSSNNSFRAELRSTSYAAVGLIPIWRINSNISARIGVYAFMPIRKIEQNVTDNTAYFGDWISSPKLFGETDLCYHFSFGTLSAYVNYCSSEFNKWNTGIAFGLYILPPKFIK